MKRLILIALLAGGCHSTGITNDPAPWDTDTEEWSTDIDTETDTDTGTDTDTDTDTGTAEDLPPYETCWGAEDCSDCLTDGPLGGPPGICSPGCVEDSDCPDPELIGLDKVCIGERCYTWNKTGSNCPTADQEPAVLDGLMVCWPTE